MNLLAFDAVTARASVTITQDGQVRYCKTWDADRRHSIELPMMVQGALKAVGLKANVLDGIAVGVGPGSYTGIRIGIALAKGMSVGNAVPLIGVSSLEAVAEVYLNSIEPVFAFADLGNGYVGMAGYEKGHSSDSGVKVIFSERALTTEEAAHNIPAGAFLAGWGRYQVIDALNAGPETRFSQEAGLGTPEGNAIARIAERHLRLVGSDQGKTLHPHYLRPSTPELRYLAREAPPEVPN